MKTIIIFASLLIASIASAESKQVKYRDVSWTIVCAKLNQGQMNEVEERAFQRVLDRESERIKAYEIQLQEFCDIEIQSI